MSKIKQFIRNWLEIKEPKEPTLNKELEKKVAVLKNDLEFWHRTFKSFSVIPCAHCGKQMRIYPYGGAYYSGKDNAKIHAECYDAYLTDPSNKVKE